MDAIATFEMFLEEASTIEEKKAKNLSKFYLNSLSLDPETVPVDPRDVFLAKNSSILQIGSSYIQIFNKHGQYLYRFARDTQQTFPDENPSGEKSDLICFLFQQGWLTASTQTLNSSKLFLDFLTKLSSASSQVELDISVICLDDQEKVRQNYDTFVHYLDNPQDQNHSHEQLEQAGTKGIVKKNFFVESKFSCEKNDKNAYRLDYLESLKQKFGRRELKTGSYVKIVFLESHTMVSTRLHNSKASGGMIGS